MQLRATYGEAYPLPLSQDVIDFFQNMQELVFGPKRQCCWTFWGFTVPTSQEVLVLKFSSVQKFDHFSSGGADDPPEGARWIENYEGLLGQEICLWPM